MSRFESYAQGTPSWVELVTPDPEAAAEFYGALFDWKIEAVPDDGRASPCLVASREGDPVAGIAGQLPEVAGEPAVWEVCLAVDDVDAATARVVPAGGTVEAGPFDVGDRGRRAVVLDPTGASVSLWQAGSLVGTVRADEPGTPIWHDLMTPDVPRALAFYAEVVGIGADLVQMNEGDYSTLSVGGRPVGGAMASPAPGIPACWSVYFNVESVDDTVDRALELGGAVVAPAFEVDGVGRMAVLADPLGGVFNLMQNPGG